MATIRNRRGSVLLMAIGLLTIIAILSSTFLIVSNLDAQETETLAVKAMADPIAEGALRTAIALIARDRQTNDDGPYGAVADLSGNHAQWIAYVDAVGGGDGDRIDEWLAACGRTRAAMSNYWSKIYGDDTAEVGRTDTDGDDIEDAFLYKYYDTADPNSREGKFRVAIRVVDLSGKVCINTASNGEPNGPTEADEDDDVVTQSPALINVVRALAVGNETGAMRQAADTLYSNRIHPFRCGYDEGQTGTRAILKEYDIHCGRKLLSPDRDPQDQTKVVYNPFAIGDEAFLLWCEPMRYGPIANVGRLYTAIGAHLRELNRAQDANGNPLGDEVKRLLTTFSCTSAVPRRPDAAQGLRILEYLDVWRNDQAIYDRMKVMLARLFPTGDALQAKYMAAAFVSNMKVYLSPGASGQFQVTNDEGATFTTYGYRGDVVITEVVGKHYGPSQAGKQDWAWGCAVELMNPTDQEIDLANYKLVVGEQTIDLTGEIVARQGSSCSRVVLCNYAKGADANASLEQFFDHISEHTTIDGLDLGGDGETAAAIKLVRVHTDGEIPVDQVKPEDFNYKRKPAQDLGPTDISFVRIQRDDRYEMDVGGSLPQRRITRYLFPNYARTETSGRDDNDHTLGTANAEPDAVPQARGGGDYPVTFQTITRAPTSQRLLSVGELCNIHLVSPIDGTEDEDVTFGHRITKPELATFFPDRCTRGKLPFCPVPWKATQAQETPGSVDYGGYTPDDYPDIPAGCMYAEFFTNVLPHRQQTEGRIYGRLNVNTATREALLALPWPTEISPTVQVPGAPQRYSVANGDFDWNEAVQRIIHYREHPRGNSVMAGLRADSASSPAFLTPGEVAIPLATYMDERLKTLTNVDSIEKLTDKPGFFEARHALYRAIADCITTRSDVFGVYIKVQSGDGGRYRWYYLAVVDRSSVLTKKDTPAILLFCEIQPTENRTNVTGG
ncbi:MAG: hypothetical protein WBF17_28520 [Phycisphaerae bacterium]